MNQPITADATAMIVPARNALTMNGNDHNCRMSATTFQVGPSANPMMHHLVHDLPVACARAASMPCSCLTCQSWKVAVAGSSVSVTVVTGMPAALAALTCACTSGVAFWLLNTYTLISLFLIWLSMVDLFAAVGSLPSLIASRNVSGVSIVRPRPSASGVTIDSDAPIGVPAYLVLICVMSWLY